MSNWRDEEEQAARIRAEWDKTDTRPKLVTVPLQAVLNLVRLTAAGIGALTVAGNAIQAGIEEPGEFSDNVDDYCSDLKTDFEQTLRDLLRP